MGGKPSWRAKEDRVMKWDNRLEVDELPPCYFCGNEARYDAKTNGGLWASVCEKCFDLYCCSIGSRTGRILVLKNANR